MTLGRNLGEAIEIVDGIGPRDRLVVNPSDSLAEGDAVAVNAAADDAAAAERPAPARPARARRSCLELGPLARAPHRRWARRRGAAARRLRRRPDYVRPEVATPPAWKLEEPWRAGAPDDAAPKGPWWERFGDARLDALQRQALAFSPTSSSPPPGLEQAARRRPRRPRRASGRA